MLSIHILKEKRMLIPVISVAVTLICLISYNFFSKSSEKLEISIPLVSATKATFGSVVRYINTIGTLRPFDSVIIKSEVDAKIDKIHFEEGALVKVNQLLIELDDKKAVSSLMEAKAQYRKVLSEYEPIEKLADKGVIAKVQKSTKKAEVDMCEARVEACKNILSKHKIYAPFEGAIGLKEVSRGEFVTPGKDLIKIVDCHPLKADFKVQESQINDIYVGQKIQVCIDGDLEEYPAKIIAIDPESDKITHTFDVRALLQTSEEETIHSLTLKPGRFARIKIALDGDTKGIVVPESSVEKIGEEDTLFKISDGVAIRTLVSTGINRDGMVEIITGVDDGDIVITSGQGNVLDGKAVSIQNESIKNLKESLKKKITASKKK